jgi:hypothetical protein
MYSRDTSTPGTTPESEKPTIPPPKFPDNFPEIISDFTADLTTTFPEYANLWSKWVGIKSDTSDTQHLFEYCLLVYPERFFDILYQNDDIFLPESTINTFFLPEVDFRRLYHCPDVSETTRKTLWKYLQLLLITIMTSINNKNSFGESANLFDGINESELQTKLTETIDNLSSFFKGIIPPEGDPTGYFGGDGAEGADDDDDDDDAPDLVNEDATPPPKSSKSKGLFDNLPNPADIHEKLKGLFDGKIGNLAKELAEELTDDFMGILSEDERADMKNVKNTGDVLKKLMKNPGKIMELMKSVGNKLNNKMKSGDISQEEIMKEASEMIGKMKDMGGDGTDMNDMLKNLMKNMGGLGGFGGMMGGGKTKFNTAAMGQMSKRQAQVEKMRQRMLAKQKAAAAAEAVAAVGGAPASTPLPSDYLDSNVKFVLEPTGNGSGNMSFKLPGEDGIQEKTRINHVGQSGVGASASASPEEPDMSWADETVSSEAATKTKKPKSKKTKSKK